MTKHLIFMRHAKSDWDAPQAGDHDRPLNRRGRGAADHMADWLEQHGYVPQRVLCSSAVRTRETLQRMAARWSQDVDAQYRDELYLAAPERLLNSVCSEGGSADTLMVLAHNPGLEAVVQRLTRTYQPFPTAAVAVFEMQLDAWSNLDVDGGHRLLAVQRPKEL
ncbi:SixA phosphatase family protein [Roseimaritima sediminicola]|uniref:SixA phosphatase family protein n=1 Tax=Roseimaritima sediminicola TaxID=2662066 RepID=UPI0012983768|nr:histidine phosphatase family protein [Roseimaritima sediminicola]